MFPLARKLVRMNDLILAFDEVDSRHLRPVMSVTRLPFT